MSDVYRWKVTLGDRTVIVKAENKFWATKMAAQKLSVAWSRTVRDMLVLRMGKAQ